MNHLINMMSQVKKLKNGTGLQHLMDEAHKILGNPIVMFNMEYSLLLYTKTITDDPIWNEIIDCGSFSKETQRFFADEGFIEEIANSAKITLLKSEKLKYDRMAGKLFNKNNSYVSNLMIIASNKPFEKDDFIIFEIICKLISKELGRSAFYQEYEQTHQETVIKNLIDGHYDIRPDVAQVGIIYDSLESSLYIAVADISQCSHECVDAEYFKSICKQIKPAYKYAVYANYIIIIISTNDDMLNVKKDLSELIRYFDQYTIYTGISSRFENLFELKKYYEEALENLQFVMERKCSQRIFPYQASSIDAMKQINALPNGVGIPAFLDIAPAIFINPVLFHDMELNLLGYSSNTEICDPIWEELIAYGTSSDETIQLFKTEGFIYTMECTKAGALLISDKIKYDRISWKVYSSDNIMIGCLSIINSIKPFSEDELVLFGAFTQKFSKEVIKIEFYNDYGQVYSETVINRLLSGKIDDYTFYSEDIGNIYDNLMDNLYLIAVDTSQSVINHINLTYFRNLFNRPGTVNRYAIYFNYIIIIISRDHALLSEDSHFDEISKVFVQNNIYAGISSCFEDIYELQKYYIEAVNALSCGLKKKGRHSRQRIFKYDEI